MTRQELDQKIREVAPQWLVKEVDWLIQTAQDEEWDGAPTDCVECFDILSSQDIGREPEYKRAMRKIYKGVSLLRKLKEGEEALVSNDQGTRHLKAGQWYMDGTFEDLITK